MTQFLIHFYLNWLLNYTRSRMFGHFGQNIREITRNIVAQWTKHQLYCWLCILAPRQLLACRKRNFDNCDDVLGNHIAAFWLNKFEIFRRIPFKKSLAEKERPFNMLRFYEAFTSGVERPLRSGDRPRGDQKKRKGILPYLNALGVQHIRRALLSYLKTF